MTVALVEQALTSGARLEAACKLLSLSVRTLQRWRAQGGGEDRRRGPRTRPSNKLSDKERARLLTLVHSEEYRDLAPKQLVPRLADQGIYVASESTVYRVLAQTGHNTHRQPTRARVHKKPAERVATGPAQLLCWDITYLPTLVRGQFYYLYLYLDVWSRKIVDWRVHDTQSDVLAAELLKETCSRLGTDPAGIVLHADNGKPMKGSSMLSTMQWLGIVPSFSRPHVSDDNPFVEALFRTLKYRPGLSDCRFASIAEASLWVERLVGWYNYEHLQSAIGFVTPHDRHTGLDRRRLQERRAVYEAARLRHPERWTGKTRSWTHTTTVRLHPDRQLLTLPRRTPNSTARYA